MIITALKYRIYINIDSWVMIVWGTACLYFGERLDIGKLSDAGIAFYGAGLLNWKSERAGTQHNTLINKDNATLTTGEELAKD